MGVRGPAPKPAAARRRRNKPPEQVELAPRLGPAPALGLKRPLASTREWWKTVWASPMASAWLPSDVPALRRLASLLEESGRGDATLGLLAEIRHLEDRFGLSPLARARLQWKPADATKTAPAPAAAAQSERWLRAVDA